MSKRKKSIIIKEFWNNYSAIMSITLALSPFLLIVAARGFLFPLVLLSLFLIVFPVICILYAFNKAKIVIDKENKEIMQALRGTK